MKKRFLLVRVFLLAFALALSAACTQRQPQGPTEFFPLGVGYDWVYDVTKGTDREKSSLQFHIVDEALGDRGEKRFFLDEKKNRYYVQHGDVIAYSVTPEIWTIFLAGPLRQGSKFDGGRAIDMMAASPGPNAPPLAMHTLKSSGYKLVTALDRTIEVPAGTFSGCMEVTHVAGYTTGVKYFAPGVGMVFAEAFFDNPRTKKRELITRQELVYYRVGSKEGGSRPQSPAKSAAADTDVLAPLVTSSQSP